MSEFAISAADVQAWETVLGSCALSDVYHTASSHLLAEKWKEGEGRLVGVTTAFGCIAIPLLFRRLDGIAELQGSRRTDATSVYGYSGPVSSILQPTQKDVTVFAEWLETFLRSEGVICVFSRLHPLLGNERLLRACGGVTPIIGSTVAIDLTLPDAEQWAAYRSNHRRDVRKAERDGLVAGEDVDWRRLDDFVRLYTETMERTGALASYFHPYSYFEDLHHLLGSWYHMLYVEKGGKTVCVGLFSLYNGILQYHLGAAETTAMPHAPLKLLLDFARTWGASRGARVFHLGGGVSGKGDKLLHFKVGFSKLVYDFRVWKWVLDREEYRRVLHRLGIPEDSNDAYFPEYRSPARIESASCK